MSDISPLAALQTTLAAAIDASHHIVLTPALVPPGAVQTFISSLPETKLALDGCTLTAASGTLTLTGRCAGPWSLPRLAGIALSDIDVRIVFTAAAAAPTGTVTITGATMGTLHSTILVAGEVAADGTVALHVSPLNHVTPTVGLADLVAVLTGSQVVLKAVADVPLLQSIPVSGVDLAFGFAPAASTSISVAAQLASAWNIVDGGLFALAQPGITLAAIFPPAVGTDPAPTLFSASLHATTVIGPAQFGVALNLSGTQSLEFDVVPQPGKSVPALLDLAGAIGGDAGRAAVQGGVQALGLGDIGVDALRVSFDPAQRKLTAVTLDGHLTLGGGRVDLIIDLLPSFTFSGTLAGGAKGAQPSPSGISLNALATQVLGDAADLPHLVIDQLALSADPGLGAYSVMVDTAEDWSWDISGHGAGPVLTLRQVGLHLERTPHGAAGGLSATVALGGFSLALSADYRGKGAGWLFSGTGADPGGIAVADLLGDLARKLGATVPAPLLNAVQSLRIANLSADIDTHSKVFDFAADVTTTGQIPLGFTTYELDLRVSLTSVPDAGTGGRTITGHLEADLDIGDATFALVFDFGTAKTVTGTWTSTDGRTLHFLDIAHAIGINDAVVVPGDLDLGLKSASFVFDVGAKSFTLSAESALFGDAFFTTAKGTDGRPSFVFGVDFPKAAHLSNLPSIGSALKAADFLTFEQASILIASNTLKDFSVPPLPALPATDQAGRAIAGRSIAPLATGAKLQLAEGLSVAAELDFNGPSADARLANMRSILGTTSLVLQASIGPTQVALYAALSGKVFIPAGSGRLALVDPAVRIDILPEPAFQLSGGIGFSIQGTPVTATARMIIAASEAQVAVSLAADQAPLPAPPGVRGLHMEQFGVEMGVFFEPPGVDLGVQAKFRIGPEQALHDDECAMVLEIVGDVPNLLYLSFYIDKLDLGQAVTLFTDRQEPAVVQALEIVKASDLSFHWSENQVVLPDGTVAAPGFGFSASVQIFTFGAHAELEVGIKEGIYGRAEMSPINLHGILHVQGDGKGIMRTYQQSAGVWQEVENNAIVRQLPPLPTRRDVIVPAGGPVIEFNATRSPFVHVSWNVTLFDLVREVVDVTISDSGFSFLLTYDLGSIARFDMRCMLKDADNFSAGADLSIHLDATIGPIHFLGINVGMLHLKVDVGAAMAIVMSPSVFSLSVSGHFQFEGLGFTMPTVSLSAAPASLTALPGAVLAQIKASADQIFHDLFSNAAKWADMIGRGVVAGVTDMAGALKSAYKVTADEAAKLMRTAKQSAETVAAGLKTAFGLSANAAATTMRGVGFAASEVASGMKTGFGLTEQGVAIALKGAGFAADETAKALQTALGETAAHAAMVLKGAGYAADQVGNAMRSAFGQSAQQVASLLRGAGYASAEVANVLKSTFGQGAQQVAGLLKGAGYGAEEVGNALKNGFGLGANAAAQVLRGAGYGVNEVGNALRVGFGATQQGVAAALKGAGFAVNEVGSFMKSAFNLGPDALKSVLEGVGFAGDQVQGFFNSLGGDFAKAFGDVGHALDFRNW